MDIVLEKNEKTNQQPLKEWVQVAILAGLGIYFAYIIISGNLSNYINERFVWLSYTAVILFFAMAGFAAYQAVKQAPTTVQQTFSTAQVATWSVILTAVIPLILGFMIPSKPLGAEAIQGSISTSAVLSANEIGFSIAPENRNILDWLREFNNSENYESFNGQPADVTGFIYREPDFAPNHFMVARFTVSCCVADASAIGLPVYAENADTFETGVWVRVQGDVQVGDFREDVMPIIQSEAIERVDMPEHPYLYP